MMVLGGFLLTIEDNLEIGCKMMEAVNKQDLKLLDDLLVPEYVNQQIKVQSREDLKQKLRRQYRGFPDVYRTMEDIIADEDTVWIRVKITGTHTGEYRGIAPTGKKMTFACIDTFKIVDGKIAEAWHVYDFLDFYRQLGVIEYKGFPDEEIS